MNPCPIRNGKADHPVEESAFPISELCPDKGLAAITIACSLPKDVCGLIVLTYLVTDSPKLSRLSLCSVSIGGHHGDSGSLWAKLSTND